MLCQVLAQGTFAGADVPYDTRSAYITTAQLIYLCDSNILSNFCFSENHLEYTGETTLFSTCDVTYSTGILPPSLREAIRALDGLNFCWSLS